MAFTIPPGKLSHLVNPIGGAGRCTTAPLNLPNLPTPPPPPPRPAPPCSLPAERWLLSGLYKQTTPPPSTNTHPTLSSQLEHKGSIYQYVLVTFRGQCCCSWTQQARSQRHSSVSAARDACLGGMSGVGVRSAQALRWSVPPRVSETRKWNWQKWNPTPVLCGVIFSWRWRCVSPFTGALSLPPRQWLSPPCPHVMSHTGVAGFTRSPCPVVNRGSRFRPIVMEVAL